ncbi:YceI family protein [Actinomadura viridis]|uniref:Polyisoprenoid-binding protein YceI n=1 Tax=Actinomadura viridis TaxID=58110 RepID=A0A931DT79_9ACTN|nr:YceI family protein [Actinomadura viridis]MBG6093492.1 polyisoprenoid-binding protein YceI [Actinomadura viridis]
MTTIALGPDTGSLLLRTGRSGLGRRAGHDLTIEATRWSGTVTLAGDGPGGHRAEGSSAEVTVPVDGLEIREGTGGVLPLSDQDRTEIAANLRKILQADRYPEITFTGTRAEGAPSDFSVEGRLTIMGRTEPLTVRGGGVNGRIRGAATVKQSRWGIKPYSAFFGALKLADEVEVVFDLAIDLGP